MLKIVLVLFIAKCMQVSCDCILKDPNDELSQSLLKKIEPLKGSIFKANFKDKQDKDKYHYTMGICNSVTSSAEYVGVLQEDVPNLPTVTPSARKIGMTNSTLIKGGTDWIMLTYTNGDNYNSHCSKAKRQAHIMIICDQFQFKGSFRVLYEENDLETEKECFYMMELTSSVACQHGISTGSILLIVFFSVVTAYLIFGAIYKRCVYGSKGWEQIPNIGFWKSCGTLQADGCNYLCRCQEGAYSDSRPYHGIADDQLDDEIDDEHLLPM